MGVKFGVAWRRGPLAKFHPHRCNVSPLRGEKPQNRPLSKLNTGRFALRNAAGNHRSDIKLQKNTAISIHFNDINHNITDIIVIPIEQISQPLERKIIENFWINELKTRYTFGGIDIPWRGGWKHETGKCGTKLQDCKTWDCKTRERIGNVKPIKPKQPTHFHMLI